METAELLTLGLFVWIAVTLLLGFPVAFSLAGGALVFGIAVVLFSDTAALTVANAMPQRIQSIEDSEVLLAVPLFVFMGVMLERSKVAEELLDNMGKAFGPMPGGLAISVCVVGALLAASTGIVGATVVTMGLLSLPTMLRRGYDKRLTCGTICASGTLGQIIPPSIVLVLLGDQLQPAYQTALRAKGDFSGGTISVNELFAGALFPGLILVGLYILYILAIAFLRPKLAPSVPADVDTSDLQRWGSKSQGRLVAAAIVGVGLLLILAQSFGVTSIEWLTNTLIVFSVITALLLMFGLRIDRTRPGPALFGLVCFLLLVFGIIFVDELDVWFVELFIGHDVDPKKAYKADSGHWLLPFLVLIIGVFYGAFANAWRDIFWGPILRSLIPPLVLIVAVLGSILAGLASPTEAAAVGATGALMLAGFRLNPEKGRLIVWGGVALVLMLVITAYFDLRLARDAISGAEWVAIVVSFVLGLLLFIGIVMAIFRASTYRVGADGAVAHDPGLDRERLMVGFFLFLMVGAMILMTLISPADKMLQGLTVLAIAGVAVAATLYFRNRERPRRRGEFATVLSEVVRQTMMISSMVFVILIGAAMFSLVFRGVGGEEVVTHFLKNLPTIDIDLGIFAIKIGAEASAILIVMLVMFLLGFFLDFLEIVFIVVPIVAPIILQFELDGQAINPVWLGIVMAIILQTSFLTPPFGFALFYLRGVAPAEVKTLDIYRGIIPFVVIQLASIILLWYFPGIVTYLPESIYAK